MQRAWWAACLILSACTHNRSAIGKACDGTVNSCITGASCVSKICVKDCATDQDCQTGQVCNGTTCSPVQCTDASQCPVGQACTDGLCWTYCDSASPCNGACCDGNTGLCADGSGNTACGASPMCTDCRTATAGPICLNASTCGCKTSDDCPGAQVCANGACTTSCDGTAPCSSGCCSNGQCVDGTGLASCGSDGLVCSDCTSANAGTECLSGQSCGCATNDDCTISTLGAVCIGTSCGCQSVTDCPPLSACDTTTGQCTSSCSESQLCSTGLCDKGSCIAGACVENTLPDANGVCPAACDGATALCVSAFCCDSTTFTCVDDEGSPNSACGGSDNFCSGVTCG